MSSFHFSSQCFSAGEHKMQYCKQYKYKLYFIDFNWKWVRYERPRYQWTEERRPGLVLMQNHICNTSFSNHINIMKYLSSVKFCQLKSIKVCLPTNPVFHFQPVKGIHSMPLLLNPVEKAFFVLWRCLLHLFLQSLVGMQLFTSLWQE